MNCPNCGAPTDESRTEYLATGDWTRTYMCGTIQDDNGHTFRGRACEPNTGKPAAFEVYEGADID